MEDSVLAGTLPQESGGNLINFQKAMRMASTEAYDARAKDNKNLADKQFDPTKVSGSTFAGIMGNLEQEGGKDISKIYASTVDAYKSSITAKKTGLGTAGEREQANMSNDLTGFDDFFSKYRQKDNPNAPGTNYAFIPRDVYLGARNEFIKTYGVDKAKEFDTQYAEKYLSTEDAQEFKVKTAGEKTAETKAEMAESDIQAAADIVERYHAEEDIIGTKKRVSMQALTEAGLVSKQDMPKLIAMLEQKGIIVEQ